MAFRNNDRLKDVYKEIDNLRDRILALEYPPKFKIGDKVYLLGISKRYTYDIKTEYPITVVKVVFNNNGWIYTLVDCKTNQLYEWEPEWNLSFNKPS